MSLRDELKAIGRPLRVVVTGGREYDNFERVAWALDGLHKTHGIARLAHGGAGKRRKGVTVGADRLAGEWADECGVDVEAYPVSEEEWDARGNSAGPIRNRAMLDREKPDLVVAFPGDKGTRDCTAAARERGLRVWVVG